MPRGRDLSQSALRPRLAPRAAHPGNVRCQARAPGSPPPPPHRSASAAAGSSAARSQPPRGLDRGQPLVHQPYAGPAGRFRRRGAGPLADLERRRALRARQRPRQSDDDLDRFVSARQRQRSVDLAAPAGTVATGKARVGRPSHSRDPDPASPQSSASRTPRAHARVRPLSSTEVCRTWPIACSTAVSAAGACLPSLPPPWAMSALPPPRPPSVSLDRPDQVARLEPAVARAVGGDDDDARLVRGATDDGDHGRLARDPVAHLQRERAQVVARRRRGAVGRCS